jgi:DNA-binding NarL/FixJ family response regulator
MTHRVLIADDHALMRRGIEALLDDAGEFEVVAHASDGVEAVRAALAHPLDLAILDIGMPKMTGLQAAEEIARQRPDLRVLLISMHRDERYVLAAIRSGAAGYVLKSGADEELVDAARAVLEGASFIAPQAMRSIVERVVRAEVEQAGPFAHLTARETEVMKMIAEGLSAKEIGESLNLSEKTVSRHRSNILSKLGLVDRVGITRYAIRNGLVDP